MSNEPKISKDLREVKKEFATHLDKINTEPAPNSIPKRNSDGSLKAYSNLTKNHVLVSHGTYTSDYTVGANVVTDALVNGYVYQLTISSAAGANIAFVGQYLAYVYGTQKTLMDIKMMEDMSVIFNNDNTLTVASTATIERRLAVTLQRVV